MSCELHIEYLTISPFNIFGQNNLPDKSMLKQTMHPYMQTVQSHRSSRNAAIN